MRTDVAIVGGGLSGLYAARLLLDAGIEFQLLEARHRFGGRILSVSGKGDPSPDGFDLGPSWFWPGMQPRMALIVDGLGLRAFPQHTDGDVVVERSRFEAVRRFPKRLKEGVHDCKGLRMRMDALDGMVLGEVAKIVLEPGRLTELLEGYINSSVVRSDAAQAQLAKVRHAHKEAEVAITRLLGLVEQGLMDPGDPALRDRLTGLRLQRNELAREVAEQQKRLAAGTTALTPEKIRAVGILLRDKLFNGPPELRQAYARLLLSEVAVTREEIRITGSKSVLARCATAEPADTAPAVLSFVQKWRPRQDSNL